MQKVEKMSIAVTPEMAGAVRAAVESGEYASTSEVIREALRLWKSHQAARAREVDTLRRAWQEKIESGAATRLEFCRGEGEGARGACEGAEPNALTARWRGARSVPERRRTLSRSGSSLRETTLGIASSTESTRNAGYPRQTLVLGAFGQRSRPMPGHGSWGAI